MHEDVYELCNNGNKPIEVWIEPWAHNITLSPGENLNVVGRSKQQGKFEVTKNGHVVAIYGWPGSSIRLSRGNEHLEELPDIWGDGPPPGMSAREFIERAFGGPGGP